MGLEWLLSEVVVALIGQTLGFLVIRFVMECIALVCIVVTSATIVVDHVLVGVAEHISAVLTLLQFSSFHGSFED